MSKGQKPMVGARIPHSWKSQIEVICQETGKCESAVVQEAIAQFLGRTDPASAVSMNKRLTVLEKQVKKLTTLAME